MHLFYDEHIDIKGNFHQLTEEESKHAIKVMRLKQGDSLILLNGKGARIVGTISDDHPKRCIVTFDSVTIESDEDLTIHVAVSPTKQMERMEWFIEKATEIGITRITFIQCQNSERVQIKPDRLIKKAVSAMKQSQRAFLPTIDELTSFKQFVEENKNGMIAHCREGEKNEIKDLLSSCNGIVLIGPEGDFTIEEISEAEKHGYKMVTLGENRLRTETAALYATMQLKLFS